MIVALEKGGRCVTLSSYILTCGSLQLWPLWPAAAADVTWNHCSQLNPVTQLHFWHVRPEPKKSLCHVLPAAACCRFQKEKKSHVDQLMDLVEASTLLPLISLHHQHGRGKKRKAHSEAKNTRPLLTSRKNFHDSSSLYSLTERAFWRKHNRILTTSFVSLFVLDRRGRRGVWGGMDGAERSHRDQSISQGTQPWVRSKQRVERRMDADGRIKMLLFF